MSKMILFLMLSDDKVAQQPKKINKKRHETPPPHIEIKMRAMKSKNIYFVVVINVKLQKKISARIAIYFFAFFIVESTF